MIDSPTTCPSTWSCPICKSIIVFEEFLHCLLPFLKDGVLIVCLGVGGLVKALDS